MSDIVLTTQNARYSHTAFGLRCLRANLGDLRGQSEILEYDLRCAPRDMATEILSRHPRIVGISVYIWNRTSALDLIREIRKRETEVCVIVGGPEVSFDAGKSEFSENSDFLICGEGEDTLRILCLQILDGHPPQEKTARGEPPNLNSLVLPYAEYTDEDVSRRLVYVETTRGCPFECEYCISALDVKVRRFPLEDVLSEFEKLLERGVRQFKFVDRTFNVDIDRCIKVMEFFLRHDLSDVRLHFEMMPDRFPDRLREIIQRFPGGALHFEIGIQTYNEEVAERIKRKTDYRVIDDNLRFLRDETGALIHADLIAGLPGESVESFAAGFDRLVALRPHELQFGILKKLKGAPIDRHDDEWQMKYSIRPPYEVISTSLIDAEKMTEMKLFARFWDLFYNRGNFDESVLMLWSEKRSPFDEFMKFSLWLRNHHGKTHAIPLDKLADSFFIYLTTEQHRDPQVCAETIWKDYHQAGKRRYPPLAIKPHLAP